MSNNDYNLNSLEEIEELDCVSHVKKVAIASYVPCYAISIPAKSHAFGVRLTHFKKKTLET